MHRPAGHRAAGRDPPQGSGQLAFDGWEVVCLLVCKTIWVLICAKAACGGKG